MFAEEQFLRGKFGQAYLDWAAGVPAFWPALGRWKSPEVGFSLRNVLKREYNGFFAMFLSFAWVDGLHGFRASRYGRGVLSLRPPASSRISGPTRWRWLSPSSWYCAR